MKILNIIKTEADASTQRMIKAQSTGNEVAIIYLSKGGISYDKLVADVFSYDKVFCW